MARKTIGQIVEEAFEHGRRQGSEETARSFQKQYDANVQRRQLTEQVIKLVEESSKMMSRAGYLIDRLNGGK